MLDRLRQTVLGILRVPPRPQAPDGTAESTRIFRAGRNFYRWQLLVWAISNAGAIAGAVAAYVFALRFAKLGPAWVRTLFNVAEALGFLGVAATVLITFLALRLSYELRWYIVTDRSLRIRRGVWSVEELTMTFANIQEIRVTSGPIQNLLRIANVEVHSAGGGGGGSDGSHGSRRNAHVASFEGVENADEIRDCIVDRLRAYRDLGLGGGERAHPEEPSIGAAKAVLEEVRSLRNVWPQPSPSQSAIADKIL